MNVVARNSQTLNTHLPTRPASARSEAAPPAVESRTAPGPNDQLQLLQMPGQSWLPPTSGDQLRLLETPSESPARPETLQSNPEKVVYRAPQGTNGPLLMDDQPTVPEDATPELTPMERMLRAQPEIAAFEKAQKEAGWEVSEGQGDRNFMLYRLYDNEVAFQTVDGAGEVDEHRGILRPVPGTSWNSALFTIDGNDEVFNHNFLASMSADIEPLPERPKEPKWKSWLPWN